MLLYFLLISFKILPTHMNLILTSFRFNCLKPLFYSRPLTLNFIQGHILI